MPILRLTQYAESQPDRYRVEIALEGDGPRQTAQVSFSYQLSEQDQENIRWYLEDYLQYPHAPAPQIAARVEQRMVEIGIDLFKAIFQGDDDARDLWANLRPDLNNTRIEILTEIEQTAAIPWELIRDPRTDTPLALRAPAFVRIHSQAAQRPKLPQTDGETIRILLVICRPKGKFDVPFRSVASRILKGLGNQPNSFQLNVLRPPTFEALSRELRQAKAEGKPYHVVHFDGHGVYEDSKEVTLQRNPLIFRDQRPGMHGYLAFENSANEDNVEFVNGSELGRLLVETDVPVLVLNACRSAHTEAQNTPDQINEDTDTANDVHAQVRAFGSLAQEVIDSGIAGVVAMRYNVYVMTAAQFVTDLYAALVQGQTLGEAVSLGRKQLNAQPQREIASKPISLQDWLVPVVYEAAPIPLFPKPTQPTELKIILNDDDTLPTAGWLDSQLPRTPDAGFFGRDETLLAIDRAFDENSIVLIHAFAGSGKTSTAAEFGRWYSLTGGVEGPVLFTSFERYLPLSRVLDRLGHFFQRELERSGIHWLTLKDSQRREIALQVLSQIPILWIWDNVEPIAGFPDGGMQKWTEAEQQELVSFIRDSQQTKAKFLLTSRRDEVGLLGSLPTRIPVPEMQMQERIFLTKALARKHRYSLNDFLIWYPLLIYSQGNPLTLTILVNQALNAGYKSKIEIEEFVSNLRRGEVEIEDDLAGGRTTSLTMALCYGFSHEFTVEESKKLSLLYLFQGFLNVTTLGFMGRDDALMGGCLDCIKEFDREAWIDLLDRTAKVGISTNIGPGLYTIHPAVTLQLSKPFKVHHLNKKSIVLVDHMGLEAKLINHDMPQAIYAFVHSVGLLAVVYHYMYAHGDHSGAWMLQDEEFNLLNAYDLGKRNGLWFQVCNILQGLSTLYTRAGRWVEWKVVFDSALSSFIDLTTDQPLLGRESSWSIITSLRIDLLINSREFEHVERLSRMRVQWNRDKNIECVELDSKDLAGEQVTTLGNLAGSILQLGAELFRKEKHECVSLFEEAYVLNLKINNKWGAAIAAYNLGNAYLDINDLHDLDKSEYWYEISSKLRSEDDLVGKSKSFSAIGRVYYERCITLIHENYIDIDLPLHLAKAIEYTYRSLDILPDDIVDDKAITHGQLGMLYGIAGDLKLALLHLNESIRYEELQDNQVGAAMILRNIAALLMAKEGSSDKALMYAKAALSKYESLNNLDIFEIQKTKHLISCIEHWIPESEVPNEQ